MNLSKYEKERKIQLTEKSIKEYSDYYKVLLTIFNQKVKDYFYVSNDLIITRDEIREYQDIKEQTYYRINIMLRSLYLVEQPDKLKRGINFTDNREIPYTFEELYEKYLSTL